ncbi:hypothetical protein HU734_006670 [Pseudomonas wayambapalatensis]|nr:hypothetical protein HU734_006670 [Pseudomonas wayambapalatensis]
MSLTAQEIQDCKALVTSIWGASVAANLDYNEGVVEVVRITVEQISICSQRLADFFSALVIVVGGVAAAVYSRMWLIKGAKRIADEIQNLKEANLQARACIAQAAATYRSPLEMASLGI